MAHSRKLAVMAILVVALAGKPAPAQFGVSFQSGYSSPFSCSPFYSSGFTGTSGFGHYGLHSAPHYGPHFGSHFGPYNSFGFRNDGIHSGAHVDVHSGTHSDFHDFTGHTGSPLVASSVYGFGLGYGSPGYLNGFSLSYGLGPAYGATLLGNYMNYSYNGGTRYYVPSLSQGYGRSAATDEYLRDLAYDRTGPRPAPRREEKRDDQPADRPGQTPARPEGRDGRIERGDVQIDFLNGARTIEVAWLGRSEEAKAVTFMLRDAGRVPLVLRRITGPPFKTRFDLADSIRYVTLDVEFKDGVTTTTQIPLPER